MPNKNIFVAGFRPGIILRNNHKHQAKVPLTTNVTKTKNSPIRHTLKLPLMTESPEEKPKPFVKKQE